jgi:hypothetical protein
MGSRNGVIKISQCLSRRGQIHLAAELPEVELSIKFKKTKARRAPRRAFEMVEPRGIEPLTSTMPL